jgi:hypothetical protein
VPLSTAHRFWNSSTEPVVFEVEIRPARKWCTDAFQSFYLPMASRTSRAAPRLDASPTVEAVMGLPRASDMI